MIINIQNLIAKKVAILSDSQEGEYESYVLDDPYMLVVDGKLVEGIWRNLDGGSEWVVVFGYEDCIEVEGDEFEGSIYKETTDF